MQDEIPESRSRIMRAIKGKDTKSEVLLAKRLWHKGYRYRKHDKEVFGTPDLTFRKYRVAIFVDGEFFHGKDWDQLKVSCPEITIHKFSVYGTGRKIG